MKAEEQPVDLQIEGKGRWRMGQRLHSIGDPALSPLKKTHYVPTQANDPHDFAHILADEAPMVSPDLDS